MGGLFDLGYILTTIHAEVNERFINLIKNNSLCTQTRSSGCNLLRRFPAVWGKLRRLGLVLRPPLRPRFLSPLPLTLLTRYLISLRRCERRQVERRVRRSSNEEPASLCHLDASDIKAAWPCVNSNGGANHHSFIIKHSFWPCRRFSDGQTSSWMNLALKRHVWHAY